ncbi:MAG: murein biosynthesis integral membrane protein MurJ [Thermacetogeniaceae bacterium]
MAEASARGRLARAALLLTAATITSRLMGYVRDAMLYAQFGQNRYTDIYQAAFKVPDFFYALLVGGALSSAFIPVFGGYLANKQEDEAWYAASSLFNLIFLLLVIVISLGMIFAPHLVFILVPGFDASGIALTAHLTRIMFVQTLFMGLAGIMIGVLNSYKRFTGNALSIMLYNVPVLLIGLYLFHRPALLNDPARAISYYSVGVVAGAVISVMIQFPSLLHIGLRYHPVMDLRHPGVKQFSKLVFPVLISQSVAYFNTFVTMNLASGLPGGQLAASSLALRIMQIPLGLFAQAIGIATFPTMTEQAAQGRMDDFRRTVSLTLRTTNFLTFPAAAGLVALGFPITRLFFQFGKFTTQNAALTSVALFYYAFGIIGYSAEIALSRAFYAIKDTVTPVRITIGMIVLNIVLSVLLVKPMGLGGLALAYSTAGLVEMVALLLILRIRIGRIDGMRILSSGIGSLGASLVMGLACYLTALKLQALLGVASKLSQLLAVSGSIAVGILVYFCIAYLLRMEEVQLALEIMGRRFSSHRGRPSAQ